MDQNGLYFCKNEKNSKFSPPYRLTVQTPVRAKITDFKVDKHLETKVLLICSYVGNPEPSVQFFKDGVELKNATILNETNESKIILDIKKMKFDESYYECKIKNRWTEDTKILLFLYNQPKQASFDYNFIFILSIITGITLTMIVCLILFYTNFRRCYLVKRNKNGGF